MTDFDKNLEPRSVNFVPLTPLDFIARSSEVYGAMPAVVYGKTRRTWAQTYERCRRLASSLATRGIQLNDTVAVLLPNIPEMVEVHFAVPMAGAVLNALNTRLDYATLLFMLRHGEAKLLIIDSEYSTLAEKIKIDLPDLIVIGVHDDQANTPANPAMWVDYEVLINEGDPNFIFLFPWSLSHQSHYLSVCVPDLNLLQTSAQSQ